MKLIVFSGNTDGAVPTTDTLRWLGYLNMDVKDKWRQWMVDD